MMVGEGREGGKYDNLSLVITDYLVTPLVAALLLGVLP